MVLRGGGTPTAYGLKQCQSFQPTEIVLLTDGEPADSTATEVAARELKQGVPMIFYEI